MWLEEKSASLKMYPSEAGDKHRVCNDLVNSIKDLSSFSRGIFNLQHFLPIHAITGAVFWLTAIHTYGGTVVPNVDFALPSGSQNNLYFFVDYTNCAT